MEIDKETLRSVPKTDLHCHLDGSIRPETAEDFLRREDQPVPDNIREELMVYDDCSSLTEYLTAFDLPVKLLQTKKRLRRVARELANDAISENVWYLEVRFAPYLHLEEGLSLKQVVRSVLEGLKEVEQDHTIKTGIILSGLRQTDPEKTMRLAEMAVEFKGKGVIGLDLAGAEKDNPAKEHIEAFYLARNENLNLTIHAGEDFGPESIHQAIHYCGAHRIGHGVRLKENPDLLNYFNDHRIPLEMCPTSNVQTGAVKEFDEHPIKSYLDQGLRVTLNTDNRTVSNTTVTNEYYRAVKHYGLNLKEIRKLILNGFKSAFLPYNERSELLKKALEETEIQLYQKELEVI